MAVVYRMFDENDELLYVGHSKTALRRMADHLQDKTWIDNVVNVTFDHYPSVEQAKAAELQAIKDEFPLHNVVGTCDPMYRDPSDLIALLNLRERRLLGGILFGLGSMRGPLLDEVFDLEDLAACLRHLGTLMAKEQGPIDAVLDLRRRLERARLLGLGEGYKAAERELPPTAEIREGIRLANRYPPRLSADEEADSIAS
jgi:hypothetical protein